MIAGDELSVVLAILSLGISLTLAGVSQAGWRNKSLIVALFVFGAVSLLVAVTWPLWKAISPTFSGVVISISVSPVSWFVLLMFTAAAFLFNFRTKAALERYITRLAPEQKASLIERSAWKQEAVFDGQANNPPRLHFVFAENGRNARLYVDYSVFYAAIYNPDWTSPIRLEIKKFDHFARDQKVSLELFEKVGGKDSFFWRFSHLHERDDSTNPKNILNPNSSCRGRVTLLTDDNREGHCYFIAEIGSGVDGPPRVFGQHMFDHAWKWEDET